ncbi:MAG: FG-GAP-like repeat-containing protein, partial [Bacteroidetes bacterium]|nr:FG-GAP-like repeat-containing protein [Bacteroidota bacterium]
MTCFGCFRTFILPFFWAFTFANAQQWITTASPARNATGVISFTPIILTGTEALNTATVIPANIRVNGSYSGPISLSQVSYNSGANSITIVPSSSYAAGEKITVSLTPAVTTSAGAPISGIIQFHAVVRTAKDNFSDSVTVLIKDNTGGVSSADVNKDGYLDLIVNDLKGFITVYINNKNKTFRAAQTFGDELFGWSAGKNVSADFDGDADIDILLPIKWGRFQLFTNNGGTFTKQEYFLSMGSLNAENMVTAELADLNSDGLIDVASPN